MTETRFTVIRDIVRQMDPELRQLWAQAIAHEEGARTKAVEVTLPAYYAWNRVHTGVDEAAKIEQDCLDRQAEHDRKMETQASGS